MLSNGFADGEGEVFRAIQRALSSEPRLIGFFGCLAFALVVIALVLYRRHRFRFWRVRSSDGITGTLIEMVPARHYPPISGFEHATAVTEWPSQEDLQVAEPERKRKKSRNKS